MSLFEALDTSKGGMFAQEKATAIVSTNIANISTTGYKRSDTAFSDLVTTSRYSPSYESGGVRATRVLRADQQGSIQQTGSATDAAITGNGFFVVSQAFDTVADSNTAPTNLFFTRNGTFNETVVRDPESGDSTVYLANAPGQFLYAWPFDDTNTLPPIQDFSTLEPVNISQFDDMPIPTTQLTTSVNLDASATNFDPHIANTQLPANANSASSFSRSFTVFDTAGQQQDLSFEYRKITGPMAHFTSNGGAAQSISDVFIPTSGGSSYTGISIGDSIDVDVDGVVETYTFVAEATGDDTDTNQVATMGGLIRALDQHGVDLLAIPPVTNGVLDAQIDNNRLIVRSQDPTSVITLTETSGTPLSSIQSLNIVPDPLDGDFIYEPQEDLATPTTYPDQGDFPAIANITDPTTQNWWELTIVNPSNGDVIRQGLLNFDGNGRLNATPDADGNFIIDLATNPIDFDGDPATEASAITVNISNTSQLTGSFQVINSDQNGAGIGTRTGLQVLDDGRIVGIFSNGLRADLYQIPLANFGNVNGLNDQSGTIFAISNTSGDPTLAFAGQGGNGTLRGAAIENSNVDTAQEFANLIVSQRGYSLNSQVIQAINEMAERLGQL